MGQAPAGLLGAAGQAESGWACARLRLQAAGPGALWASLPLQGERFAWRGPDGVWWLGAGHLHLGQVEVGEGAAWAALAEAQGALAPLSEAAGLPWRAQVAVAFDPDRPGPAAPAARTLIPAWLGRLEGTQLDLRVLATGANPKAARWAADEALNRWCRALPEVEPPLPLGRGRWATAPQEEAAWRERVQAALRAFEAGAFHKLVASREARLLPGPGWGPFDALRAIAPTGRYAALLPTGRPRGWWLMASPERLLEACGREVGADALAGTAARGATPVADAELAAALAQDPKELAEHDWVVQGLREALGPLCEGIALPERPELRRLPNVQHLFTPLRGRLKPGVGLLEAARALHPTPAVGGWPREGAKAWLAAHEAPRGWYAGALGHLEPDALELAVGLRGGHWGPGGLVARAGGGLVAASQVEREWQETERKLGAWAAMLGGER